MFHDRGALCVRVLCMSWLLFHFFEIMFTWQPFQRNIKVPAKRMLFQLKRKSTVFFLAGWHSIMAGLTTGVLSTITKTWSDTFQRPTLCCARTAWSTPSFSDRVRWWPPSSPAGWHGTHLPWKTRYSARLKCLIRRSVVSFSGGATGVEGLE